MPNKARQGQTNPNPTPAPTPELQEHQGRENSPESASGKGLPPASIAFASAFLREHLPRRKKQPANDGTVFRGRGRGEVHSGGGGGGADQEAAGKQKKGKTETTCKSIFSGRAVGGAAWAPELHPQVTGSSPKGSLLQFKRQNGRHGQIS